MKPGVYVNFMSGDEQSRVPEAYHQRWERMVAIKSQYDPQNFFRLNQNVPPRTVAVEGVMTFQDTSAARGDVKLLP